MKKWKVRLWYVQSPRHCAVVLGLGTLWADTPADAREVAIQCWWGPWMCEESLLSFQAQEVL